MTPNPLRLTLLAINWAINTFVILMVVLSSVLLVKMIPINPQPLNASVNHSNHGKNDNKSPV